MAGSEGGYITCLSTTLIEVRVCKFSHVFEHMTLTERVKMSRNGWWRVNRTSPASASLREFETEGFQGLHLKELWCTGPEVGMSPWRHPFLQLMELRTAFERRDGLLAPCLSSYVLLNLDKLVRGNTLGWVMASNSQSGLCLIHAGYDSWHEYFVQLLLLATVFTLDAWSEQGSGKGSVAIILLDRWDELVKEVDFLCGTKRENEEVCQHRNWTRG